MEILLWIGFAVGILFALLLMARQNSIRTNWTSILLMLSVGILYLAEADLDFFPSEIRRFRTTIGFVLAFTLGPLLFLNLKSGLAKTRQSGPRDYLHFTLPILCLLVLLSQVIINSPDLDYYLMLAELLFYEILFIQLIVYLWISFLRFKRWEKEGPMKRNIDASKVRALKSFVGFQILIFVFVLIGFHLNAFTTIPIAHLVFRVSVYLGLLMFLFMGLLRLLSIKNQ